jgi:hypothetical protein
MANWVLANDANALLIDTGGNGTQTYASAVPISSSGGVLSASLIEAGIGLDQTNLIATFDGNASTVGKSPVFRLRLASTTLPNIGEQDFTFQWKLTMGMDGIRDYGERQVYINGGLSVHVGAAVDGRILLYANPQSNKQVTAISGSGNPFSAGTSITTQDVIAQVFVANGSAYLDVDLMGLISKLDANASLLFSNLTGYTPQTLLLQTTYNLSLGGLPLVSASGEAQTLSIIAPIEPLPNHAPSFVGLADTLAMTEDTPVVLSLNASDPENHNLTFSMVGVNDATLSWRVEGNQITLTPAANYANATGLTLQVKVADVYGAYNLQTLNVSVAPVDDPAMLSADTARVREGRSLTGNVLLNDTDLDSVLSVKSFYFTGAPSISSETLFNAGQTASLAGVGSFGVNALGDYVWQTATGFSGALPVVHYQTPQGEESTLSVTAVPLAQAVGPSQLTGQVMFWNAPASGALAGKHSFVDGVQLSGLDELSTQIQSVTDTSGRYSLPGFQPLSVLPLTVSKAAATGAVLAADVKSAITLSDVLDALKIYLNKAVATPSSYKYVAADFDANGTVNLSDVLGILKTYLGKTSTTTPAWAWVDAQADVSALSTGTGKAQVSTALSHTFSDASITSDTQNWVAVLRGDVNGSWVSPTPTVENISHDQFLQLVGVSTGTL